MTGSWTCLTEKTVLPTYSFLFSRSYPLDRTWRFFFFFLMYFSRSLYWDKLFILNVCNLMSLEVSVHLWRDCNIRSKYIHHLQIFFQPSLERILLVQCLIHFKLEVDMSQMSNWCSVSLVVNRELAGFMWPEKGCLVRDK